MRLESWEVRRLGGFETGKLGGCAVGGAKLRIRFIGKSYEKYLDTRGRQVWTKSC